MDDIAASPALRRALARIRKITGADLAFSGIPNSGALRLSVFDGPVAGPLRHAALSHGHGLGGRVVAQQRPFAVSDYVRSPSIVHTYDEIIRSENLRAMVAVPVMVGRSLVSVIYAASRVPQSELGRVFDAVVAEARDLEHSLVVKTALHHSEVGGGANPDDLVPRMRAAYEQLRLVAGEISDAGLQARIRDIADQLAPDESDSPVAAVHLTARELDVLTLMASGHSNPVVASQLGVGLYTVKGHVKNIMNKLNADTRFEAVVNARSLRLLP